MSGIETAAALSAASTAAGGGAAAAGAGAAGAGAAGAAGAGAAGAGAAGAGAAGAAGAGAVGAGAAGATGAGALGAGAVGATGAGATGTGLLGAGAVGEGMGAGMLAAEGAAAPGAMSFVTPSVTQGGGMLAGTEAGAAGAGAGGTGGTGGLSGSLAGTSADYGAPSMLAEANASASAAPQPGMFGEAGGYMKSAGKAASNYNTVNKAMGGGQPQRQAPAGRPVFQGEQAPIASQGQPAPNQNAVLAAIARRRQRGF